MLKKWIQPILSSGITRKLVRPILLVGTLSILLSVGVITALVGYFLYENTKEQIADQTNQMVDLFAEELRELDTAVLSASSQLDVNTLIKQNYSGYREFTTYRDSYNYILMINSINPLVNLYIFVPEKHYVMGTSYGNTSSDLDIETAETTRRWFHEIQQKYDVIHSCSYFVPPVTGGDTCFASLMKVHSLSNWSLLGVIAASLDKSFLDNLVEKTDFLDKGVFLVLNEDGSVAYSSDGNDEAYRSVMNEIGELSEEWKSTHFTMVLQPAELPYRFVGMLRKDETQHRLMAIMLQVLCVFLISLLIILIISYIMAHRITRPIREMTSFIEGVEASKLTDRLHIHSHDEIETLANSFNAMLDSVQENQVLRRQAQLNALQKQIDPHFQFNTLETIKGLAVMNDTRGVYDMLTAFGEMLKYNTNRNERSTTTIREELEHVKNYLFIQKIRFKERLSFKIMADDALLDCVTLKFVLQPLVENSLRYAMEPAVSSFRLLIRIYEDPADTVRVDVVDNGPGIEETTLQSLLSFIRNEGEQGSFGIGLKNIDQRIKLHFSDEYGLSIESKEGYYTKMSLRLPKRRECP